MKQEKVKPFSCPLYVSCEKYHYTLIFLKKKKSSSAYLNIPALKWGGGGSEKKSTFKRRPFLVNGSKVFDFNKKTQIKNDKTGLLYFRTSCFLGPEYTNKV